MLVILFAPHCLIYVIKRGSLELIFFISLTSAGQLWQQRGQQEQRDDDHDEDNLTR